MFNEELKESTLLKL